MNTKPIICLDFDNTIHSYVSGWQGARNIPDPPVPGAIDFLYRLIESGRFKVAILSSRSHQFGGRGAMRRWLHRQFVVYLWDRFGVGELERLSYRSGFTGDEINDDIHDFAHELLDQIDFCKHKPPATVTIDDRAIQFKGEWPTLDDLATFKPYRCNLETA